MTVGDVMGRWAHKNEVEEPKFVYLGLGFKGLSDHLAVTLATSRAITGNGSCFYAREEN